MLSRVDKRENNMASTLQKGRGPLLALRQLPILVLRAAFATGLCPVSANCNLQQFSDEFYLKAGHCPRRVLAQRPKPEEALIGPPRIKNVKYWCSIGRANRSRFEETRRGRRSRLIFQ